jgi:O-antigen/teichoic acid export membrane protein
LGFGLTGVFWGYLLSFVLPFLITLVPLQFLIKSATKKVKPIAMGEIIQYGLPAAVAVFSLSSFTSTDILLVKHFFPSSQAALYSGLSLVGRIIFYFTAPIPVVMFPLIVNRFHKGEKFHNLLYTSFLLVLIPSVGITFFYFIFPQIAIHIFLGNRYISVSPYLGWFGIYLCIFSLMNVLVNFFLSLKKTYVSWVIALGALLQAICIWLFHGSIAQIIVISLVLSSLLFIVLLLYYMNEYAPQKKKK